MVSFESVGWLFESYMVLFGVIWCYLKIFCYIFKEFNANLTCFFHNSACRKVIIFLNFRKIT